MGQRICFYKNKSQFFLKELVCECFSEFKEWYLNVYLENEEKDEYILYKYLSKIIDLSNIFDDTEQKVIDEITADFVGGFLDTKNQNHAELVLPMMYTRHYVENTEDILKTQDNDFIELWNIIINGRSIKNNKPFDSFTDDLKIGFLTKNEYLNLKGKIEKYFSTEMDIKGVKFVLQAIENMNLCKEMIITIE